MEFNNLFWCHHRSEEVEEIRRRLCKLACKNDLSYEKLVNSKSEDIIEKVKLFLNDIITENVIDIGVASFTEIEEYLDLTMTIRLAVLVLRGNVKASDRHPLELKDLANKILFNVFQDSADLSDHSVVEDFVNGQQLLQGYQPCKEMLSKLGNDRSNKLFEIFQIVEFPNDSNCYLQPIWDFFLQVADNAATKKLRISSLEIILECVEETIDSLDDKSFHECHTKLLCLIESSKEILHKESSLFILKDTLSSNYFNVSNKRIKSHLVHLLLSFKIKLAEEIGFYEDHNDQRKDKAFFLESLDLILVAILNKSNMTQLQLKVSIDNAETNLDVLSLLKILTTSNLFSTSSRVAHYETSKIAEVLTLEVDKNMRFSFKDVWPLKSILKFSFYSSGSLSLLQWYGSVSCEPKVVLLSKDGVFKIDEICIPDKRESICLRINNSTALTIPYTSSVTALVHRIQWHGLYSIGWKSPIQGQIFPQDCSIIPQENGKLLGLTYNLKTQEKLMLYTWRYMTNFRLRWCTLNGEFMSNLLSADVLRSIVRLFSYFDHLESTLPVLDRVRGLVLESLNEFHLFTGRMWSDSDLAIPNDISTKYRFSSIFEKYWNNLLQNYNSLAKDLFFQLICSGNGTAKACVVDNAIFSEIVEIVSYISMHRKIENQLNGNNIDWFLYLFKSLNSSEQLSFVFLNLSANTDVSSQQMITLIKEATVNDSSVRLIIKDNGKVEQLIGINTFGMDKLISKKISNPVDNAKVVIPYCPSTILNRIKKSTDYINNLSNEQYLDSILAVTLSVKKKYELQQNWKDFIKYSEDENNLILLLSNSPAIVEQTISTMFSTSRKIENNFDISNSRKLLTSHFGGNTVFLIDSHLRPLHEKRQILKICFEKKLKLVLVSPIAKEGDLDLGYYEKQFSTNIIKLRYTKVDIIKYFESKSSQSGKSVALYNWSLIYESISHLLNFPVNVEEFANISIINQIKLLDVDVSTCSSNLLQSCKSAVLECYRVSTFNSLTSSILEYAINYVIDIVGNPKYCFDFEKELSALDTVIEIVIEAIRNEIIFPFLEFSRDSRINFLSQSLIIQTWLSSLCQVMQNKHIIFESSFVSSISTIESFSGGKIREKLKRIFASNYPHTAVLLSSFNTYNNLEVSEYSYFITDDRVNINDLITNDDELQWNKLCYDSEIKERHSSEINITILKTFESCLSRSSNVAKLVSCIDPRILLDMLASVKALNSKPVAITRLLDFVFNQFHDISVDFPHVYVVKYGLSLLKFLNIELERDDLSALLNLGVQFRNIQNLRNCTALAEIFTLSNSNYDFSSDDDMRDRLLSAWSDITSILKKNPSYRFGKGFVNFVLSEKQQHMGKEKFWLDKSPSAELIKIIYSNKESNENEINWIHYFSTSAIIYILKKSKGSFQVNCLHSLLWKQIEHIKEEDFKEFITDFLNKLLLEDWCNHSHIFELIYKLLFNYTYYNPNLKEDLIKIKQKKISETLIKLSIPPQSSRNSMFQIMASSRLKRNGWSTDWYLDIISQNDSVECFQSWQSLFESQKNKLDFSFIPEIQFEFLRYCKNRFLEFSESSNRNELIVQFFNHILQHVDENSIEAAWPPITKYDVKRQIILKKVPILELLDGIVWLIRPETPFQPNSRQEQANYSCECPLPVIQALITNGEINFLGRVKKNKNIMSQLALFFTFPECLPTSVYNHFAAEIPNSGLSIVPCEYFALGQIGNDTWPEYVLRIPARPLPGYIYDGLARDAENEFCNPLIPLQESNCPSCNEIFRTIATRIRINQGVTPKVFISNIYALRFLLSLPDKIENFSYYDNLVFWKRLLSSWFLSIGPFGRIEKFFLPAGDCSNWNLKDKLDNHGSYFGNHTGCLFFPFPARVSVHWTMSSENTFFGGRESDKLFTKNLFSSLSATSHHEISTDTDELAQAIFYVKKLATRIARELIDKYVKVPIPINSFESKGFHCWKLNYFEHLDRFEGFADIILQLGKEFGVDDTNENMSCLIDEIYSNKSKWEGITELGNINDSDYDINSRILRNRLFGDFERLKFGVILVILLTRFITTISREIDDLIKDISYRNKVKPFLGALCHRLLSLCIGVGFEPLQDEILSLLALIIHNDSSFCCCSIVLAELNYYSVNVKDLYGSFKYCGNNRFEGKTKKIKIFPFKIVDSNCNETENVTKTMFLKFNSFQEWTSMKSKNSKYFFISENYMINTNQPDNVSFETDVEKDYKLNNLEDINIVFQKSLQTVSTVDSQLLSSSKVCNSRIESNSTNITFEYQCSLVIIDCSTILKHRMNAYKEFDQVAAGSNVYIATNEPLHLILYYQEMTLLEGMTSNEYPIKCVVKGLSNEDDSIVLDSTDANTCKLLKKSRVFASASDFWDYCCRELLVASVLLCDGFILQKNKEGYFNVCFHNYMVSYAKTEASKEFNHLFDKFDHFRLFKTTTDSEYYVDRLLHVWDVVALEDTLKYNLDLKTRNLLECYCEQLFDYVKSEEVNQDILNEMKLCTMLKSKISWFQNCQKNAKKFQIMYEKSNSLCYSIATAFQFKISKTISSIDNPHIKKHLSLFKAFSMKNNQHPKITDVFKLFSDIDINSIKRAQCILVFGVCDFSHYQLVSTLFNKSTSLSLIREIFLGCDVTSNNIQANRSNMDLLDIIDTLIGDETSDNINSNGTTSSSANIFESHVVNHWSNEDKDDDNELFNVYCHENLKSLIGPYFRGVDVKHYYTPRHYNRDFNFNSSQPVICSIFRSYTDVKLDDVFDWMHKIEISPLDERLKAAIFTRINFNGKNAPIPFEPLSGNQAAILYCLALRCPTSCDYILKEIINTVEEKPVVGSIITSRCRRKDKYGIVITSKNSRFLNDLEKALIRYEVFDVKDEVALGTFSLTNFYLKVRDQHFGNNKRDGVLVVYVKGLTHIPDILLKWLAEHTEKYPWMFVCFEGVSHCFNWPENINRTLSSEISQDNLDISLCLQRFDRTIHLSDEAFLDVLSYKNSKTLDWEEILLDAIKQGVSFIWINGPPGIGKTVLTDDPESFFMTEIKRRHYKKVRLDCSSESLLLETIEEIITNLLGSPNNGDPAVLLLDEAHMIPPSYKESAIITASRYQNIRVIFISNRMEQKDRDIFHKAMESFNLIGRLVDCRGSYQSVLKKKFPNLQSSNLDWQSENYQIEIATSRFLHIYMTVTRSLLGEEMMSMRFVDELKRLFKDYLLKSKLLSKNIHDTILDFVDSKFTEKYMEKDFEIGMYENELLSKIINQLHHENSTLEKSFCKSLCEEVLNLFQLELTVYPVLPNITFKEYELSSTTRLQTYQINSIYFFKNYHESNVNTNWRTMIKLLIIATMKNPELSYPDFVSYIVTKYHILLEMPIIRRVIFFLIYCEHINANSSLRLNDIKNLLENNKNKFDDLFSSLRLIDFAQKFPRFLSSPYHSNYEQWKSYLGESPFILCLHAQEPIDFSNMEEIKDALQRGKPINWKSLRRYWSDYPPLDWEGLDNLLSVAPQAVAELVKISSDSDDYERKCHHNLQESFCHLIVIQPKYTLAYKFLKCSNSMGHKKNEIVYKSRFSVYHISAWKMILGLWDRLESDEKSMITVAIENCDGFECLRVSERNEDLHVNLLDLFSWVAKNPVKLDVRDPCKVHMNMRDELIICCNKTYLISIGYDIVCSKINNFNEESKCTLQNIEENVILNSDEIDCITDIYILDKFSPLLDSTTEVSIPTPILVKIVLKSNICSMKWSKKTQALWHCFHSPSQSHWRVINDLLLQGHDKHFWCCNSADRKLLLKNLLSSKDEIPDIIQKFILLTKNLNIDGLYPESIDITAKLKKGIQSLFQDIQNETFNEKEKKRIIISKILIAEGESKQRLCQSI